MDFFRLSKLFWFLAQPGNFTVLLLVAALALERTRRRGLAHVLVASVTVFYVAVIVLPIDQWVARPLEDRFPQATLPACVDGILVLGGGEMTRISQSRPVPSVHNAGRYAAVVALMRRYPSARIVFSGGDGDLLVPDAPDAESARAFFRELGVDPARILFESTSRNTWENLVFTKRLVRPAPGETWVLVTQALHMPRSIGVARAVGWNMLAWPTDYATPSASAAATLHWSLADSLSVLDRAVKEWIGLAAYRMTGRSAAWFPAPRPMPAPAKTAAAGDGNCAAS